MPEKSVELNKNLQDYPINLTREESKSAPGSDSKHSAKTTFIPQGTLSKGEASSGATPQLPIGRLHVHDQDTSQNVPKYGSEYSDKTMFTPLAIANSAVSSSSQNSGNNIPQIGRIHECAEYSLTRIYPIQEKSQNIPKYGGEYADKTLSSVTTSPSRGSGNNIPPKQEIGRIHECAEYSLTRIYPIQEKSQNVPKYGAEYSDKTLFTPLKIENGATRSSSGDPENTIPSKEHTGRLHECSNYPLTEEPRSLLNGSSREKCESVTRTDSKYSDKAASSSLVTTDGTISFTSRDNDDENYTSLYRFQESTSITELIHPDDDNRLRRNAVRTLSIQVPVPEMYRAFMFMTTTYKTIFVSLGILCIVLLTYSIFLYFG